MKKSLIILGLILLLTSNVLAAVSSDFKECVQRGYETRATAQESICIFPDGSNCTIDNFNQGICGEEFMVENYCVEQGVLIWDRDKCCNGLKPHLSSFIFGHPSCQPFSVRFVENLKYNPLCWFGIIIFLVLVSYIIYRIKKKRSRRKVRKFFKYVFVY